MCVLKRHPSVNMKIHVDAPWDCVWFTWNQVCQVMCQCVIVPVFQKVQRDMTSTHVGLIENLYKSCAQASSNVKGFTKSSHSAVNYNQWGIWVYYSPNGKKLLELLSYTYYIYIYMSFHSVLQFSQFDNFASQIDLAYIWIRGLVVAGKDLEVHIGKIT